MSNGTGQALGGIVPDNPKDAVQDSHILRLEARMREVNEQLKPLSTLAAQVKLIAWLAGLAFASAFTAAAMALAGRLAGS